MSDNAMLVRQAEKLINALQHPDQAFKAVANTVRQSSADIVADLATEIRATAHRLIRNETERNAATDRITKLEAERDSMMATLRAIAEGYPMEIQDDRYIIVENPKYQPDDGSNPKLVIDCARPAP